MNRVLGVVLGALAVAVCARIQLPVPGSPVPQSAQTLAVVLVGFGLGARGGAAALAAYALVGGLGAPVFADGAAGWSHLVGPTAGYLAGFVVAATLVGWFTTRSPETTPTVRPFWPTLAIMIAGHVIILGLGWARLSSSLGLGPAFEQGVAPFLTGGLAKSLVAAGVVVAWTRLRDLQ